MIDLTSVAAFVRETARTEIVPRFRALADGDITEKRPGDLVTVVDIAAERALSQGLEALAPGSVALGEEGVFADPTRLDLIAGDRPVWIIDPVDGTGNFAKGKPDFAVIVAYVEHGITTAGWIYDPLGDVLVAARRGGGAWLGGQRLRVADAVPPARIAGSAYGRTPAGERAANALAGNGRIGTVANRGCSGLEYVDVALGRAQFTLHSRSLPWDHAAGMLLVVEAGGIAAFLDGSAYDPRILDRKPLAAASVEAWRLVHEIVTAPPVSP
jgi:fructose-1,6-bisphosphatase/inositol monophosphatase family enzyme